MKKQKIEENGKGILTEEQLSERWGRTVLPGTLGQWRAMKMGPPYVKLGGKRGKSVVYRLPAIEKYELENEITPKVNKS